MDKSSSSVTLRDNAFSTSLNEINETPVLSSGSQREKAKVFKVRLDLKKNIWSREEDKLLGHLVAKHGAKKWNNIAKFFENKSSVQCSARYRRMKRGIKKDPWSIQEDKQLLELIESHGKNWSLIANMMKNRSGKQIRERYINNLDPNIIRREFSEEEDKLIFELQRKNGNKWTLISQHFNRRTGDMIKNRFHSFVKLRVKNKIENPSDFQNLNQINSRTNLNFNKENKNFTTTKEEDHHTITHARSRYKSSSNCFRLRKNLSSNSDADLKDKKFHYGNKNIKNNLKNNDTILNDFEIDFKDGNFAVIEDKSDTENEDKAADIFSYFEKTNNKKLQKSLFSSNVNLDYKLENFNSENEMNNLINKNGIAISDSSDNIQSKPISYETSNSPKILGTYYSDLHSSGLENQEVKLFLGKKVSKRTKKTKIKNQANNVNNNNSIIFNVDTIHNYTKNEYNFLLNNQDDKNSRINENTESTGENNLDDIINSKKILNEKSIKNIDYNNNSIMSFKENKKINKSDLAVNVNKYDKSNDSNILPVNVNKGLTINQHLKEISKLITINFVMSFCKENKKLLLEDLKTMEDRFALKEQNSIFNNFFNLSNKVIASYYNHLRMISIPN